LPETGETFDLPDLPSSLPMLPTAAALLIPARDGAIRVGGFSAEAISAWSSDTAVLSGFSPGPACLGEGGLLVTGSHGAPRRGFPCRPTPEVRRQDEYASPTPLSFDLAGTRHYLFAALDGRLYLVDDRAEVVDGWPLAGPGEIAGTPLLMDLDGVPGLEIATAGSFDRLDGPPEKASIVAPPLSRLTVWRLPDTETATSVWPMHAGVPGGLAPEIAGADDSRGDGLLAPGSHICYPMPLVAGDLHVRVICNEDAELVATIYNLEGEKVLRSGTGRAEAGEPFEFVLPADGLAAGPYLCRLEARSGGKNETSVISLAVAR